MASGPPTLKQRLAAEIREALKAGHKLRLSTLRLLSAAVKNREVDLRRELSDDEFLEVTAREAKRRTEAVEAYGAAGREDLASREREERDVLREYLPDPLSHDEVVALIDEAIAATGASSMKDMGKVMARVMAAGKGRVDGAKVQALVRDRLQE